MATCTPLLICLWESTRQAPNMDEEWIRAFHWTWPASYAMKCCICSLYRMHLGSNKPGVALSASPCACHPVTWPASLLFCSDMQGPCIQLLCHTARHEQLLMELQRTYRDAQQQGRKEGDDQV